MLRGAPKKMELLNAGAHKQVTKQWFGGRDTRNHTAALWRITAGCDVALCCIKLSRTYSTQPPTAKLAAAGVKLVLDSGQLLLAAALNSLFASNGAWPVTTEEQAAGLQPGRASLTP